MRTDTTTPRISIGMPVYNGAVFLAETLDSLLAQTFTDFEMIISDNASTDATPDICQEYSSRDKRIRYIHQPENLGAARNYNFVLSQARGVYFKWAAHDDLCEPEFLERCVEVLDRDPSVVLSYASVVHINERGAVVEYYDSGFHLVSPNPAERFHGFFRAPPKCTPIFGVIRRGCLRPEAIGGYPASDRILLGELSLLGKLYEVRENLFLRRIHPLISTEANKTSFKIAEWFDPQNKNKGRVPHWRLMFEYLKVVGRTSLTTAQRLRCYYEVFRYYLPPRKWLAMGKELIVTSVVPPDS